MNKVYKKDLKDASQNSSPSDLNDKFKNLVEGFTDRVCIAIKNNGRNKNIYDNAINQLRIIIKGNNKFNIKFETASDLDEILDIIKRECTQQFNEIIIVNFGEKKIVKGYTSFFRNVKDRVEVEIDGKFYSLDDIYQSIIKILDGHDKGSNSKGQNRVNFILDTYNINENISMDNRMSKLSDIFTNQLEVVRDAKEYGVLMSPIDIDCFGPAEIPQLTSSLIKRFDSDTENNSKRSISFISEVIGTEIMNSFISKSQGNTIEETTQFWAQLKARLQINSEIENVRIQSILNHNYVTYNGSTNSSKFIFVKSEDYYEKQ